jgi:hypothetical protein
MLQYPKIVSGTVNRSAIPRPYKLTDNVDSLVQTYVGASDSGSQRRAISGVATTLGLRCDWEKGK